MNQNQYGTQIDMSNTNVLSQRKQARARMLAEEFMKSHERHFDSQYIHLDVAMQKEQTRNTPAFRWRALYITDRGRFYAEDADFGALESLRATLDALNTQIESRLGKRSARRAVEETIEYIEFEI